MTQRYPSAHELIASGGDAWRAWLDEALRRVLGPAAIAGALGVAAAGCALPGRALEAFGSAAATAQASPLSPFAPTAPASKPSPAVAPSITFGPLGPPVVAPPLPELPQVVPPVSTSPLTQPVPPRRPPLRHPPMMRGGRGDIGFDRPAPPARPIQPQPEPPAIEGGLRAVMPGSS